MGKEEKESEKTQTINEFEVSEVLKQLKEEQEKKPS